MQSFSVIFDMDGVIFDTEHVAIGVWRAAAAELAVPGIDAVFPKCIGVNAARTREILREAYGAGFDAERFQERVRARYHAHYDQFGLPLKPGAVELLRDLRASRVPTALASSTRIATVTRELSDAQLLEFFDVVIGGDMVSRSKPAPDIFLLAAERLASAPEHCFVIEDSFNGIRAAHAAGTHPIMVPDLLRPTEEILRLAEHVFPSLAEVQAFLQTQSS